MTKRAHSICIVLICLLIAFASMFSYNWTSLDDRNLKQQVLPVTGQSSPVFRSPERFIELDILEAELRGHTGFIIQGIFEDGFSWWCRLLYELGLGPAPQRREISTLSGWEAVLGLE